MKLLVGLGNPGKKYINTRHNLGFRVLDKFALNQKINFSNEKKFEADTAETTFENEKLLLIKPQTYINNSGDSISKILNFYKLNSNDLWVFYDDKDLDLGKLRVRITGSSGGHKGVQSIINSIGEEHFTRFRLGIMNEEGNKIPAETFVLQNFSSKEEKIVNNIVDTAIEELEKALKNGIESVSK
jgi:PTH1 family peptidyl-tRNA hydrolase